MSESLDDIQTGGGRMTKVPAKKRLEYLSAWGNINNMRSFVEISEKKTEVLLNNVINNQEIKLQFYTWLIFNTLLLTVDFTSKFARSDGLRKEIITDYNFCKIPEEYKSYSIKKLIKLRHMLFHGGVPNLQRIRSYKEIPDKEIEYLMNPLNFNSIKKFFKEIKEEMKSIPQPSI